jgi:hypothetical protein
MIIGKRPKQIVAEQVKPYYGRTSKKPVSVSELCHLWNKFNDIDHLVLEQRDPNGDTVTISELSIVKEMRTVIQGLLDEHNRKAAASRAQTTSTIARLRPTERRQQAQSQGLTNQA